VAAPAPEKLTADVEIDAPPEAVWRVVADVRRMPHWSPELRRLWVLGGGEVRVGSLLLGVNRRGLAAWPTTSRVVRLEPGRAIAWRTRESGATWCYELEPAGGGTRVTGRRELPAYSLGTSLLAPVIGGAAGHDRELADGIRTTLARMKAEVEAGGTSGAPECAVGEHGGTARGTGGADG
jgi:uncharacterized protein YndB with AHSA1/START domain